MKKKLTMFLVVCFALQVLLPLGALGASDSSFTIASLVTVARYMTGQITLTPQQMAEYDLDGNGQVNISDLVAMAKILTGGPLPDVPAGDLNDEQIIERALAEVPGADRNSITKLERDFEDGRLVCDVEIVFDGYEYDFEIAASDGTFLSWKCERIGGAVPAAGDIGLEQAALLALARVPGASDADIVSLKADVENNTKVYEGRIQWDDRMYDFEIAASDGMFIKWGWDLITPEPGRPTTRPSVSPSAEPSATASPAEGTTAAPSARPTQTASPSGQPALTPEEARQVVLSYIPGATAADFTEFKQDTENGMPVFEGEVRYNDTTYEFKIAAADGERILWSWERRPQAGTPGTDIGMTEARSLALAQVPGATQADITKSQRDTEDGVPVYKIEIEYAEVEYEFEIVASTGEFCKQSFERRIYQPVPMPTVDPDASATPTRPGQPSPTPAVTITQERAREIALAQVPGATSMNITKCRFDSRDNVFEIEIRYSGREYEFEIDAASGTIIKQEAEQLPDASAGDPITPDAARQLVLDRVPGATIRDFREFGIDYDHGRMVFEGELRYNGTEYEFKIDAYTGEFLEWEAD